MIDGQQQVLQLLSNDHDGWLLVRTVRCVFSSSACQRLVMHSCTFVAYWQELRETGDSQKRFHSTSDASFEFGTKFRSRQRVDVEAHDRIEIVDHSNEIVDKIERH